MLNNFWISQKSFIYFYWHKTVYIFNVDEFKYDCGLMVLDFIVKTYVLSHSMNISDLMSNVPQIMNEWMFL